ncbi:hypothetical protein ACS0TY_018022 [Phlomoides rotata]
MSLKITKKKKLKWAGRPCVQQPMAVAQNSIYHASCDKIILGRGEMGCEEDEGVMGSDFFWSYTDELHASRRKQILSQYPQIKQLFGPDPLALLKIAAVVLLQLWTATFLNNAAWLKILILAYFFFGSFLNHNLFLAIHELSHNLAFSTPNYNRCLGISSYWCTHVCNFPEIPP